MKSVFFSILIFAGVFLFAGSGFFEIIGENWFHYLAYFMFALVMLCAIYITLIKERRAQKGNLPEKASDGDSETKQKEGKQDEK